jgi:glucose-6-phosphate 1-epimerase
MTDSQAPAPTLEQITLGELNCWRVRAAGGELLVAQQGAQVLSYQRDGEPPLIWLSEQAGFARGVSVRGGAPVCWPWFGDLTRNPADVQALHGDPASATFHGEVRALDWQLTGVASEGEAAILDFAFVPPTADSLGAWQHVELTLSIRLDQRLTFNLTSHNRGPTSVALSQALHTYFAVGDIRHTHVLGLDGCRYIETLEDWGERQQSGPARFSGETDRIYLDVPDRVGIEDLHWKRRITLETRGSSSAIVWNPWIEKAQRLSNFADDAWQRMLCIETANVMTDAVRLAPGQVHSLAVTLGCEPL